MLMNEKLTVKSARLVTGSGIILPAIANRSYRILDWRIGFSASTSFCLFAGSSFNHDGESGVESGLMHSETVAASAYSGRPDPFNSNLFVTVQEMPVRIHTTPNRTPLSDSFIRYEEV